MDFGNFCGLRTGFPAVDTSRRVNSFLPTEAAVRASTAREFVRGATTQVAPSSHLSRLRGCWACRQRPSLRCCCCSDAHPRGHRTQGNCRRLHCWRRSTSNPEGASGLKKLALRYRTEHLLGKPCPTELRQNALVGWSFVFLTNHAPPQKPTWSSVLYYTQINQPINMCRLRNGAIRGFPPLQAEELLPVRAHRWGRSRWTTFSSAGLPSPGQVFPCKGMSVEMSGVFPPPSRELGRWACHEAKEGWHQDVEAHKLVVRKLLSS